MACYRGEEDYGIYDSTERHRPPPLCLESHTQPTDERTYVMYHGTSILAGILIVFFGFIPSRDGMLGPGVYVSRDLRKASRYPLYLPVQLRLVLKLLVRVGKVKRIDHQGHPMQKTWHNYGYDTAWVPPNCGMVTSGQEEDCLWDPKRITVMDIIYPVQP